ncbi:hypothetical protein ACJMK2_033670, partial [Sinanodonta woodiana]
FLVPDKEKLRFLFPHGIATPKPPNKLNIDISIWIRFFYKNADMNSLNNMNLVK